MYIMCVILGLFSALSCRVGALQISITIIIVIWDHHQPQQAEQLHSDNCNSKAKPETKCLVCACVCVYVCAHACMCVCMHICVCRHVIMCMRSVMK